VSVVDSARDVVMAGPLLLAAPIALAAGVLSFFSPCCLPLVPGFLSFVTGSVGADAARTGAAGSPALTPRTELSRQHALARRNPNREEATAGSPTAGWWELGLRTRPAAGRGTMVDAVLFVLGFAAVFTSYGAAFGGLGSLLLEHQLTLTRSWARSRSCWACCSPAHWSGSPGPTGRSSPISVHPGGPLARHCWESSSG